MNAQCTQGGHVCFFVRAVSIKGPCEEGKDRARAKNGTIYQVLWMGQAAPVMLELTAMCLSRRGSKTGQMESLVFSYRIATSSLSSTGGREFTVGTIFSPPRFSRHPLPTPREDFVCSISTALNVVGYLPPTLTLALNLKGRASVRNNNDDNNNNNNNNNDANTENINTNTNDNNNKNTVIQSSPKQREKKEKRKKKTKQNQAKQTYRCFEECGARRSEVGKERKGCSCQRNMHSQRNTIRAEEQIIPVARAKQHEDNC